MNISKLIEEIKNGALDAKIVEGFSIPSEGKCKYISRLTSACESYRELYGDSENIMLFSTGGRSEISGNHTDHNNGRVIAASVNLDVIAVASPTDDGIIRVKSEGFPEDVVAVADVMDPEKFPKFKSSAIIAGMCAAFCNNGHKIGGFTAYTTSNVLKGSGLSSSAAFEVMIGNILSHLYNDGGVDAVELALDAQWSENNYFGKPCGLMDQTACAVGGFITIDFADPKSPVIEKISFDLSGAGYALVITDTGGNHADLNDDYASIPAEMKSVAAYFGKPSMRGVGKDELIAAIPALRTAVGDRAVMRAMHFIAENGRVGAQVAALNEGDVDGFLKGVLESGGSSFKYLQNVFTVKAVSEQGPSLALLISEDYLASRGGAWRVHGGGFAGTVQAFVPYAVLDGYVERMKSVFGEGAVYTLSVRRDGAVRLL